MLRRNALSFVRCGLNGISRQRYQKMWFSRSYEALTSATPSDVSLEKKTNLRNDDATEANDTPCQHIANSSPPVLSNSSTEPLKTTIDINLNDIPKNKSLMIQFSCNVCNNRQTNYISKEGYYNGVVIIKCQKCQNNHLIKDNLGWFGPKESQPSNQ
jgi:hypothetical protein